VLLLLQPGLAIRLFVGLPVVAHLGYRAATALPMGMIPGRPEGSKQVRRNQDLRSWIVRFLNEVKELEDYLARARTGNWTAPEVEERIRVGRQKVMAAATKVAEAVGRTPAKPEEDQMPGRETVPVLTHARPTVASPQGL